MEPIKIGVAIIESLGNEKKTGKNLFDTTLRYIAFDKTYIENEYFDVKTSTELLEVLEQLYQKAIVERKFYFLHFEVHGKEGGIELQNGETVSWQIILPYLRQLNILYKNKLAVYMAVCKGNSLIQHTQHTERAPFGLLLGSFFEIYTGDIIEAFEIFYTVFFKELSPLDGYNAIKVLNLKSDFIILTSKHIIDMFLKLESEFNDKDLVLTDFDKRFKDIEPKSDFFQILNNFRSEMASVYDAYKVNPDFFLMTDLE